MKSIVLGSAYLALFILASKVVFAVLGSFELSRGMLGIDWTGVAYTSAAALLASLVLIVPIELRLASLKWIEVLWAAAFAIVLMHLYQAFRNPTWFLQVIEQNAVQVTLNSLIFGGALAMVHLLTRKANKSNQADA